MRVNRCFAAFAPSCFVTFRACLCPTTIRRERRIPFTAFNTTPVLFKTSSLPALFRPFHREVQRRNAGPSPADADGRRLWDRRYVAYSRGYGERALLRRRRHQSRK